MNKDFGFFFSQLTESQQYVFNDILLDDIVITRLPDNVIIYSNFTNYEFKGNKFALSLDFESEDMFLELFHDFFKTNLSIETITRFRNLFLTDSVEYVKFGEYNYRFNCSAILGKPISNQFETYIPFIVDKIYPNL